MSALRLLILLSLTIFCGEMTIMVALDYVHIENEFVTNIVDATTLVVIVFPFLYFFIFRSTMQKNKDLTATHQQLLAAKEELEQRIAERTNEITATNGGAQADSRATEHPSDGNGSAQRDGEFLPSLPRSGRSARSG